MNWSPTLMAYLSRRFGLAVLIVFCAPYGLSVLGLGWFVCLVIGALHLNLTR